MKILPLIVGFDLLWVLIFPITTLKTSKSTQLKAIMKMACMVYFQVIYPR